ncbi:hypothetical protein T484DRAFT_1785131, partial [Baffinella frigidus]
VREAKRKADVGERERGELRAALREAKRKHAAAVKVLAEKRPDYSDSDPPPRPETWGPSSPSAYVPSPLSHPPPPGAPSPSHAPSLRAAPIAQNHAHQNGVEHHHPGHGSNAHRGHAAHPGAADTRPNASHAQHHAALPRHGGPLAPHLGAEGGGADAPSMARAMESVMARAMGFETRNHAHGYAQQNLAQRGPAASPGQHHAAVPHHAAQQNFAQHRHSAPNHLRHSGGVQHPGTASPRASLGAHAQQQQHQQHAQQQLSGGELHGEAPRAPNATDAALDTFPSNDQGKDRLCEISPMGSQDSRDASPLSGPAPAPPLPPQLLRDAPRPGYSTPHGRVDGAGHVGGGAAA